jgi:acid phosphatase (class A)
LIPPELPGWFKYIFAPASTAKIGGAEFPEGGWDPLIKANAIAAAFASESDWPKVCDPGPPDNSDAVLAQELEQLMAYSTGSERSEKLDMIVAQADDFTPYWANLLICSRDCRPATWTLVLIGQQVGALVATYFKFKYMRSRPAQMWTSLAPQVITPGHPSYPSGHALQAFLIAECVKLAAPATTPLCDMLAQNIAKNREIAGVHFPSDTAASQRSVPNVRNLLMRNSLFIKVLNEAADEWHGTRVIG